MYISGLIQKLENLKYQHGDLEVLVLSPDMPVLDLLVVTSYKNSDSGTKTLYIDSGR